MARVQVSFKNNDKELKLYDEVMRAYDKSAFIKECIRFYLDNKDMKLQTKEEGRSDGELVAAGSGNHLGKRIYRFADGTGCADELGIHHVRSFCNRGTDCRDCFPQGPEEKHEEGTHQGRIADWYLFVPGVLCADGGAAVHHPFQQRFYHRSQRGDRAVFVVGNQQEKTGSEIYRFLFPVPAGHRHSVNQLFGRLCL